MSRQDQITNLQCYLKEVDKDITLILQNLQWNRSLLSKEQSPLTKCKYNGNHRVSKERLKEHEELCFLKQNGYSAEDVLLPELLDTGAPTVVKFNSNAIKEVIDNAAKGDPLFNRVSIFWEPSYIYLWCNSEDLQPLSTERLQIAYTADERRAIHDAVVSSVRTQTEHDQDFVLLSGGAGAADGDKSWLERLAEQRDRRRRRAKYRAPPKTRNYSLVLRDVISAQMELLSEMCGNSEVDLSHQDNERNKDRVDIIKKEVDENTKYKGTDYSDYKTGNHKSRHHSEKYSYENNREHHRHTEEAYRKYHAEHRDKCVEHSGSSKCDNIEQHHQSSRHKTEGKRSKYDKNGDDACKKYYKKTEDYYSRQKERSREESSKDRRKLKEHRDNKRYQSTDEYKSDRKKREYIDEKYEDREQCNSSDRKKRKYDERHISEKERSYSKSKSDYKHRKDY